MNSVDPLSYFRKTCFPDILKRSREVLQWSKYRERRFGAVMSTSRALHPQAKGFIQCTILVSIPFIIHPTHTTSLDARLPRELRLLCGSLNTACRRHDSSSSGLDAIVQKAPRNLQSQTYNFPPSLEASDLSQRSHERTSIM